MFRTSQAQLYPASRVGHAQPSSPTSSDMHDLPGGHDGGVIYQFENGLSFATFVGPSMKRAEKVAEGAEQGAASLYWLEREVQP